jgi:hypothetical protein
LQLHPIGGDFRPQAIFPGKEIQQGMEAQGCPPLADMLGLMFVEALVVFVLGMNADDGTVGAAAGALGEALGVEQKARIIKPHADSTK